MKNYIKSILANSITALIIAAAIILEYEYQTLTFFYNKIENSSATQTFISAFAGAAGAAGLIYYLDYKEKKRELLRTINTSITLLSVHLSNVLNFKAQHLIKLHEEKEDFTKAIETFQSISALNKETQVEITVKLPPLKHIGQQLPNLNDEYLFNIEKLSEFSEKFPMAIVYLIKTKESISELNHYLNEYKILMKEIKERTANNTQDFIFYMGKEIRNGHQDHRLPNQIDNILYKANCSLFFIRLTITELQNKGEILLPKKISKNLAKSVTQDNYEKFMPPKDFLEGWTN